MMGAARVAIAGQCAAPTSCRIHMLQERYTCRCHNFLSFCRRFEGKLYVLSSLSKHRISIRRLGFGAVGSRLLGSNAGRLGFKGFGDRVVRAQEEDKENPELDKVEDKPSESWTSSVLRANVVSRIFMATFVWISLFFGISVANNEIGGGRPGRRGPRK